MKQSYVAGVTFAKFRFVSSGVVVLMQSEFRDSWENAAPFLEWHKPPVFIA